MERNNNLKRIQKEKLIGDKKSEKNQFIEKKQNYNNCYNFIESDPKGSFHQILKETLNA